MFDNRYRSAAKNFLEINIGDKSEFDVQITEEMHNEFAKLFGDYSPVHTSEEFCSNTRFEKRIGYAFMLTGLLSKLYGEYLPGGSSICIKQESRFVKPFYIGDRLTITGEVVSKSEATRFIEIKSEIYSNHHELVFKGMGIVQIIFEDKLIKPLYEANGDKIFYSDLLKVMKDAGINKGDTIFVHSDISVFGKLCTMDRSFLLNSVVESLKESVGEEGNIIIPTFTYSFCKGEVFSVKNSISTVGVLSEYFRKIQGVERTKHPIFSVAILGKDKEELLDVGKDSFDQNSIFGKLHLKGGKLVFLGASFHSCTFLHYIEQLHNVNYRYIKKFDGVIEDKGNTYEDEATFFVRFLDKNVVLDTERLEKYLMENDIMKEVAVGNGRILVVAADSLYREGIRLLEIDPYFFLKEAIK